MSESKNNRLLILSGNAHKYAKIIAGEGLPDLEVVPVVSLEEAAPVADQANILLASPDLAYEILSDMTSLTWMQSTWAGVNRIVGEGCREDKNCGYGHSQKTERTPHDDAPRLTGKGQTCVGNWGLPGCILLGCTCNQEERAYEETI